MAQSGCVTAAKRVDRRWDPADGAELHRGCDGRELRPGVGVRRQTTSRQAWWGGSVGRDAGHTGLAAGLDDLCKGERRRPQLLCLWHTLFPSTKCPLHVECHKFIV